ncbi:fluoride efflux transporter FluC [Oceanibium sediminis]|uniref:fluoride efflux transporter FluC n=1 Tax=Oceanibium sediminis TaxID=2026339 RepID=UPI000DD4412A|nr:CrcB family protein [Oceanibium sediminis]
MWQTLPILQVALGGAIGAVLRYVVVTRAGAMLGGGFPWGTLAVNLVGCFLMGVLVSMLAARGSLPPPLLTAGVLGGFTTFSAFSLEAVSLIERGAMGAAAGYVAASVLGTLLLCGSGMILGRMVFA